MTKMDYVAEMLSEELEHYQITPELINRCAKSIIDGLDMWYELSGESVASNNRYKELESSIIKSEQKREKMLMELENKHSKELKEWNIYSRMAIQRKNEEIERLQIN